MSENPRPKKKSRFFSQLKWLPRSNSSKTTDRGDRAKTPPQQIVNAIPNPEVHRPPQLFLPKSQASFAQHAPHQHQLSHLAGPTQLEQSLISPRTATAAAFQSLSVEDHRQRGVYGSQGLLRQVQAKAANNGSPLVPEPAYPKAYNPSTPSLPHISVSTAHSQQISVPKSPAYRSTNSVTNVKDGGHHQIPNRFESSQTSQANIGKQMATQTQTAPANHQSPAQAAQAYGHIQGPQPAPASTYAPSHPRTRVTGITSTNTLSCGPELIPEGFKPEPPPSHPGTRLSTYVSSFRDAHGNLVPSPPKNLYTSPDFAAYQTSPNYRNQKSLTQSRKRKRADTTKDILPPPAYIYTRTNDPTFNIFHGFLLYPELCYQLALHLPVSDLINLYAISKDYHVILDTRFTTTILSIAEHLTPNAVKVFPFRCYAHLCRVDPAARIPHPDPVLAAQGAIRKVPSFKWLKMLVYREKVVHEIMALAAEKGVPFPRRCKDVLLKFWFILDIPDNARRVGYIHNERLFTEMDLYFAMCVLVRLDMLMNDPVGTEKRDGGRRMVLAQRSLSTLMLVLRGEVWKTKMDVLREWVKWKYDPNERDRREVGEEGIFGIPVEECGQLKKQYWGNTRMLDVMKKRMQANGEEGDPLWLLRPDQLIVREAVRRGLRFRGHVLKCMLYGFVDPRTLGDVDWEGEGRSTARREKGLEGHREYDFDDVVGGGTCVGVQDGGDRLLDLGRRRGGSRICVKEGIGEQERKWREGEREFTRKCYAWWQQEVAEAGIGEEEMTGWESD